MYRLYSVVRHRPPDREEDAELFGASGVSAVEACTAAQVGRVHRHHRRDPGPARRAPPHRRGPRPARVPSPPRGHGAVRTSLLQTTLRRTCSSAVSSTGKEPMAPPPEHWISLRRLSVPFVRTGTDQNAVIHLYTHELGLSRGTQCSGSGGVQVTRGRGSARGLVQCRRGRTAEQREPVVDPLSGQALASTGPLVPSPAPRAQIEPGTEQVEKALGCTFVHIEIGA